MKIGVDANEANVIRRVGSNEFAFRVLWQLYRQGKAQRWTIYLSSDPLPDLPRPKPNWQYRILRPGFFWTQWRLPLDLYWYHPRPDRFLTLGHYAPRFSPLPVMVCIMDLAFLKFPETFRKRDLWQLKAWTKYSVKKASHIFAISQATKKDIVNRYGVSPEKISVDYPGVESPKAIGTSPVREKGKYIVYVGTLQPRKNVDALIEAFKDNPCRLVIAGKIGWKYQIKSAPRVKYLGYVPAARLAALIKNSQGLVLPSLYEGFGIPVAQAMRLGVPVLVSRNSSLPEIVADCGLYIEPPFDTSAIRAGLEKLLSLSPLQKQQLTVRARLRARQFSWKNTAQVILNHLQDLPAS